LSCFFSLIILLRAKRPARLATRIVEPTDELGKRSVVHSRLSDHDKRHSISRHNPGHRLTKPALRPIALYRIADPTAGNKPYLRRTRCTVSNEYDDRAHPAAATLTIEA
jgi:hypothetical protein